MSTKYNLFQDSYAAKEAERGALRDPVGSGVVVVTPNDHGVLQLSTAGTVTLQPATEVPVNVDVLVLFQASVTFETLAFVDGDWAVFKVVLNSAGVRVWAQVAGSNIVPLTNALVALGLPDDITGDISAYNETTLKAVLTALATAGIITDSTTT